VLIGWSILLGSPWWGIILYLAVAFVAASVIRLLISLLWAREVATKEPRSGDYWLRYWNRIKLRDERDTDHAHPWVLGFLELVIVPVLIKAGFWAAIGAWFTFKTAGQWDQWKTSRHMFNRFLIGNALLIIFSWLIAGVLLESTAGAFANS
jgi:hypothetical protein